MSDIDNSEHILVTLNLIIQTFLQGDREKEKYKAGQNFSNK